MLDDYLIVAVARGGGGGGGGAERKLWNTSFARIVTSHRVENRIRTS